MNFHGILRIATGLRWHCVLVLLTVQIGGCQEQPTNDVSNYQTGGVAIVGSSTAVGVGASAYSKSWVGLLSKSMDTQCPGKGVASFARSGYTTWHFVPAQLVRPAGRSPADPAVMIEQVLLHKPLMVIIQLNSNDPAYGYPAKETIANHRILLDSLKANGIAAIVVGPFPRYVPKDCVAKFLAVKDSFKALADSNNVVHVWDSLALDTLRVKPGFAAGDRVHLNNAGHAMIYRQLVAHPAWRAYCKE